MGNETSHSSKVPHPRTAAKSGNSDYQRNQQEVGTGLVRPSPSASDNVRVNLTGHDDSETVHPATGDNKTSGGGGGPKTSKKLKDGSRKNSQHEGKVDNQAGAAAVCVDEMLRQSLKRLDLGNETREGETDGDETTHSPADNYIDPQKVQIGQVIGEGGFGRVFKATLNGSTKVAAKLILVPFADDEDGLNQLLALKHKNFATIIGVVRQTSQMDPPQLLLQYYQEGNVLQFLNTDDNDNPKDNATLGKFALDISQGCQFLHSCNVVHGNLAARNILVQKIQKDNKTYYNAKISDIGIIRFAEPSGGNYVKVPGNENMIVPLRWVPKEIIDGSTPDFTFSADVWAFGVVLWEMWTKGSIPYGATSSNPKVIQYLKDGSSPLEVQYPTGCPPNFVALMKSLFQVDPMLRPTFTELVTILQRFKGHGITTGTSGVEVSGAGSTAKGSQSGKLHAAAVKVQDTKDAPENSMVDEKAAKKKKEKAKQKADHISASTPSAASQPQPPVGGTDNFGGKSKGCGPPAKTPKSQPNQKPPKYQDSSADAAAAAEVEALRKRVAQLEKEKRGGGKGSDPGRGRGAQGQDKRGASQPRRGRGGRGGGNYQSDEHVAGIPVGGAAPPGYFPAPPPPYTEQPLPYHSSPHVSAPPPQYVPGVGAPVATEDDTFAKMKKLEQGMALIEAKKKMQEVADLMKVASGLGGAASTALPDSKFADPLAHSIPPQQFGGNSGADQYYTDGQGSYGAATGRGGHRGQRQGSAQSRPYHKGRGGGGGRARGRAGQHNEAH